MARAQTVPKERKTKQRGNGQGTVRQVGKKWRWEITLGFRADGTRISRSGYASTKKEAEDARNAMLTDYKRGLIGASDDVTVAEYAARWLKRQHDVKPKTQKRAGELLAYALEHIGKKRLRDVRPQHLKDLMATLAAREMKRGGTMAPRTLLHIRAKLRSMFREAVSDQIIYVNPMDSVKRSKLTAPISAGEVFDEEQMQRFAAIGWALEEVGICRLFPALFMAVSLGLRREEVAGLLWKHVDLERGILSVREVRTGGVKGTVTGEPKTLASRRDIPMPQSLVRVLKELQSKQERERKAAGAAWENSGYVIAGELGGPVAPDNLNRTMKRVIEWSDPDRFEEKARHLAISTSPEALARLRAEVLAGGKGQKLPSRSPHDLRHTYATLALKRGVPVEVVSKILGHASVSITLDTYRHVFENEKRAHVVDLFETMPPRREPEAVAALN
ncbi:tyrosine-type recombinase/integrase [Deinococcus peraridilitoris]|uniref:Site-specific recombinase XerD n=1 Tax=Deinococcus peraridilitoris (strain DSM 19664 / LMG 22246 / CIP 109416 / KR-200) TaxID=937777 RepID=L0A1X5_DEIPD|nr:site-specific integrase [Deinococcus peraridilitoris]AFZ67903.1 site-specific recombinase XerD [Deinococcus peraridilitoris DSM 19664]